MVSFNIEEQKWTDPSWRKEEKKIKRRFGKTGLKQADLVKNGKKILSNGDRNLGGCVG